MNSLNRKSGQAMRMTSFSFLNLLILLGCCIATYRLYRAGPLTFSPGPKWPQTTSSDDFRTQCLHFKPRVSHARLELLEFVEADSRANLAYRDISCGGPGESNHVAQDICRVAIYVETSVASGIHLEAWLPREWNSRFLGTGNGGLNGCLDYASLLYTTSHDFASVASNNGHNGTSGETFYRNPDVLHDFADRAIHTSSEVGKVLVKQFYGSEQKKSYFLGCSQGGRQGIANAVKFPHDFDGIVAGAPAIDFNNLASWRASFYPLTGPSNSLDFIRSSVWAHLIHDEVLRQCDLLDGVRDGIIEYPDLCKFDPNLLRCKEDETAGESCLSQTQIEKVRKVFDPLTYLDGTIIFPGMQLGSEEYAIARLDAGAPFSDSRDWFKYVVHADPSWEPLTFTTDDAKLAQQLNPFDIRTFPVPKDFELFRAKGGKILSYHGMQDQQITGHNTGRWLQLIRSHSSSDEEIDQWLRYFPISGLLHCSGGPGAWMIGQTGGDAGYEPEKNVLAAIINWVEAKNPPDILEGTKLIKQSDTMVQFSRRHCRWPKRNHYIGQKQELQVRGDTNLAMPTSSTADEWICV